MRKLKREVRRFLAIALASVVGVVSVGQSYITVYAAEEERIESNIGFRDSDTDGDDRSDSTGSKKESNSTGNVSSGETKKENTSSVSPEKEEGSDAEGNSGASDKSDSANASNSSDNTDTSDKLDSSGDTGTSGDTDSSGESKDSNTPDKNDSGNPLPSKGQEESAPDLSQGGNTDSVPAEPQGEATQKPDTEPESEPVPPAVEETIAIPEVEELIITYILDMEDSATVKGKETVSLGSSLKFTVKAKDGFEIAAVYANGEELISVERAKDAIASASDAKGADAPSIDRQTYKIPKLEEDTEIEIQMSEVEDISILTEELDGMLITVEALRGVLPEDAKLQVKAADKESVMEIMEAQSFSSSIQKVKAFDIKILDADGSEIEPKDGIVKVSITALPFESDENIIGSSLQVYYVDESGSKVKSMDSIADSHTVEFETPHFSIYAVVMMGEAAGEQIEIKDGENYLFDSGFEGKTVVLYGNATAATITIDEGVSMNLILGSDAQGLSIDAEGAEGQYVTSSNSLTSKAAINLLGNVNAAVTLKGDISLSGDDGFAGIYVNEAANLTIDGDGTLNVSGNGGGAGIGGNHYKNGSIAGRIIIDCDGEGTIIADSTSVKGSGAAAIGGGEGQTNKSDDINVGDSVYIEIKNGHIEANSDPKGTTSGAAIGSGNAGDARSIIISGGRISARSTGAGAAIGSGNHSNNSGENEEGRGNARIVITGGVIDAVGSGGGAAIGTGCGSSNASETNGGGRTKAPGYYYTDIDITGGEIRALAGDSGNDQNLAAAIGGGQYCDAKIHIGGSAVIHEAGVAENALSKWYYQGAPGIGGGYQGYAEITIDGDAWIESASGGCGAPGIGSGAVVNPSLKDKRATDPYVKTPLIIMNGGTIEKSVGGYYAAGIGSGYGTEACNITINGGTIKLAQGGNSPVGIEADIFYGGAGIGSGVGSGIQSNSKYSAVTTTNITINGGIIERAIGGWGAAGIGSGARNILTAELEIDAAADVAAFADGTKFAMDTFTRTELGVPESADTMKLTERGGSNILQGTFMDRQTAGIDYTGLTAAIWEDGNSQSGEELLYTGNEVRTEDIPEGYRSFAVTVDSSHHYLVAAHKDGNEPVWFQYDVLGKMEIQPTPIQESSTYHYATSDSKVSDNQWLYARETQPEILPEIPVVPETPEVPEIPVVPETPEVPEIPVVPETPEIPVVPETPEVPEIPVVPEVPAEPLPPESPEVPVPSTPGGGTSGNDRGISTPEPPIVTILPEEVPLAAFPSEINVEQLVSIADDEVPLAGLPKMGNRGLPAAELGLLSMLLIAVYGMLNKKKDTE